MLEYCFLEIFTLVLNIKMNKKICKLAAVCLLYYLLSICIRIQSQQLLFYILQWMMTGTLKHVKRQSCFELSNKYDEHLISVSVLCEYFVGNKKPILCLEVPCVKADEARSFLRLVVHIFWLSVLLILTTLGSSQRAGKTVTTK